MTIVRDGKLYEIIDESKTDYAVMAEFDFAEPPHERKLKLWWDKRYCTVVRESR